jgi:hypothetical protein
MLICQFYLKEKLERRQKFLSFNLFQNLSIRIVIFIDIHVQLFRAQLFSGKHTRVYVEHKKAHNNTRRHTPGFKA